ncbi:MAG: hypothetical protein ACKN9U_21335, partial [Pirellulaceae bacterium]
PQPLSLLTRLERQQMDRWPFQSSSRFIEKRLIDRRDALLLAMVGTSRFLQRRLRYLATKQASPAKQLHLPLALVPCEATKNAASFWQDLKQVSAGPIPS